jgi:Zn-finger nucleic acid-binding protein
MDTHYYAGPGNVVIDSCSRCCLNWFDYGELRRIASAPEHRSSPDSITGI